MAPQTAFNHESRCCSLQTMSQLFRPSLCVPMICPVMPCAGWPLQPLHLRKWPIVGKLCSNLTLADLLNTLPRTEVCFDI